MLENFPTMTKEEAAKIELAREILVAIWPTSVKIRDNYGGNDRARLIVMIMSVLGMYFEVLPGKVKETWENYGWDSEEAKALATALIQLASGKKQ